MNIATTSFPQRLIGPAVRADFRRLYPANAKTPTCCPSNDNRTKVTIKLCDVGTVPLVARWPVFLARGSDADGEPHYIYTDLIQCHTARYLQAPHLSSCSCLCLQTVSVNLTPGRTLAQHPPCQRGCHCCYQGARHAMSAGCSHSTATVTQGGSETIRTSSQCMPICNIKGTSNVSTLMLFAFKALPQTDGNMPTAQTFESLM